MNPPFTARALALALGAGILLPGCMVGPDYREPDFQIQGKWRKFEGGSDRAPSEAEAYWWKKFHDPVLNRLVQTAVRQNPDLRSAGVRVLGARAELNTAVGNLFPQQQQFSLSGGRYSADDSAGGPAQFLGGSQSIYASQAVFSANWEIDFWGKYRRQIQSDRARFLASIAAYDAALVSLIADVANTYANLRTAQARLRVAEDNIALQKESLRMAETQLAAGQVQGLDAAMAATQVAMTESRVPLRREAADRSINGLAVLMGTTPQEARGLVGGGGGIPTISGSIATGIPRDLLRRRPDVRAAGLMAASQSARIGVAFAELLPSFSLNGSFGYGSGTSNYNSFSNLFNWQQSVADSAGSLVVPILNYGRIVNQVRVQDALFQQSLLAYQKSVLNAQREVEDGIVSYVQSRARVARLHSALNSSREAVKLARIQYEAGAVNYTTVLTAEQAKLANEEALAVSKGAEMVAVIGIYRALGGGWETRDGDNIVPPEIRKQMAERTNWGRLIEPSNFLPREQAQTP